MARLRPGEIPPPRRHKTHNLGYVSLGGRQLYLGPWPESQRDPPPTVLKNYRKAVMEWLAQNGESVAHSGLTLTVNDLCTRYLAEARRTYRKFGEETSEPSNIEDALGPLQELYGDMLAMDFGPLKLKQVRAHYIDVCHWARENINRQVSRIKRMFKWAVENELVPVEVFQKVATVEGLKMGHSQARETEKIVEVADAIVEKTLPVLRAGIRFPERRRGQPFKLRPQPLVADMVQLQRLIGCRPSEITIMRLEDVDTNPPEGQGCWLYWPERFKTQHLGDRMCYWIGPKAQAILGPLLAQCTEPKSPVFPQRAHHRTGKPRGRYNRNVYAAAIRKACDLAGIPGWNPRQLRKAAANEARRGHPRGIEATQSRLRHKEVETSQIYADRDEQLAREVAKKFG